MMKIGRPYWTVLCCLFGAILAGRVFGNSIALRPSADTSIYAAFPDNNIGSNPNLLAGGNANGAAGRTLIRFDVASQIPSNAIVQSAALAVNVVIAPAGSGVSSVFELRRVLVDWAEGIGTGNAGTAANNGEVTWDNRIHPMTPWTAPGGAVSNDFSGTVSASVLISNLGSYTFTSTTNLVADVQQWLLNPNTNFGWALISESESTAFTARRFGSREDTNNTPLLEIQYVLPAATEIQWIKATGNQIQFSFLASGGQPYTIQYRDSLASDNWLTLTNIAPQNTITNLIVIDSLSTNAQRFYRIGAF